PRRAGAGERQRGKHRRRRRARRLGPRGLREPREHRGRTFVFCRGRTRQLRALHHKACIVTDAKGLNGTVPQANSLMTGVTCKQSTVKQVVPGTYTVHCTITYSDGAVWRGIASVLTKSGGVEWEPTSASSGG